MAKTPVAIAVCAALLCACKDKPSTAVEATKPTMNSVAPDSPAGRQFTGWLTAFNSGDRATMLAYHQQHFPYAVASNDVSTIVNESGLSQGTGGFELKKIENPSATSLVAILKEKHSHQFARVSLDVDAAEKVTRFEIHPIPTPAEFLPPKAKPIQTPNAAAPDNPAGRQFAAWLAAFNSGDNAALIAYHQQRFPYAVASADVASIDRESGLSKGTGGFDLKKSESPSATNIVATLKERHSSQFARVTMEVDAAEPHAVTRFEIQPIPTPDELLSVDERKARTIDDAKRRAVIDGIAKELEAHYIFPDKAKQMGAAVRDHLAHGDYDKIADGETFADTLTKDLLDVSHDLHLRVMFGRGPDGGGHEPTPDERVAMLHAMIGPTERLSGNVAHVVINGFPPAEDSETLDAIATVMSQAADADALLLDLRANHGGSPDTVAIVLSYLFDATPVHLNDIFSRDTNSTKEYWTAKVVRGTRFGGKKPVYVLTSKQTFSGGEECAYDLQSLHRATLVGETTGGGAHPVGPHEIDDSFQIMVPGGRPINPITKTDWEGVGVIPEVKVSAESALEEAHKRALADIAKKH